ncbi:hypothetical protein NUSPORA_01161 [Nucleospora cyclopteri]
MNYKLCHILLVHTIQNNTNINLIKANCENYLLSTLFINKIISELDKNAYYYNYKIMLPEHKSFLKKYRMSRQHISFNQLVSKNAYHNESFSNSNTILKECILKNCLSTNFKLRKNKKIQQDPYFNTQTNKLKTIVKTQICKNISKHNSLIIKKANIKKLHFFENINNKDKILNQTRFKTRNKNKLLKHTDLLQNLKNLDQLCIGLSLQQINLLSYKYIKKKQFTTTILKLFTLLNCRINKNKNLNTTQIQKLKKLKSIYIKNLKQNKKSYKDYVYKKFISLENNKKMFDKHKFTTFYCELSNLKVYISKDLSQNKNDINFLNEKILKKSKIYTIKKSLNLETIRRHKTSLLSFFYPIQSNSDIKNNFNVIELKILKKAKRKNQISKNFFKANLRQKKQFLQKQILYTIFYHIKKDEKNKLCIRKIFNFSDYIKSLSKNEHLNDNFLSNSNKYFDDSESDEFFEEDFRPKCDDIFNSTIYTKRRSISKHKNAKLISLYNTKINFLNINLNSNKLFEIKDKKFLNHFSFFPGWNKYKSCYNSMYKTEFELLSLKSIVAEYQLTEYFSFILEMVRTNTFSHKNHFISFKYCFHLICFHLCTSWNLGKGKCLKNDLKYKETYLISNKNYKKFFKTKNYWYKKAENLLFYAKKRALKELGISKSSFQASHLFNLLILLRQQNPVSIAFVCYVYHATISDEVDFNLNSVAKDRWDSIIEKRKTLTNIKKRYLQYINNAKKIAKFRNINI